MNTSSEEKSVWIQLVGTVLGLGVYAVLAGRLFAAGITELSAYVPMLAAAVVLMVILLVVGHITAAIVGRPEARDERDQLIEWKAETYSSWPLAVGVVAAIVGMILTIDNLWIAHLLLLSLAVSTVLGYALRLVDYRRGGPRSAGR